jgi:hypothetical protein
MQALGVHPLNELVFFELQLFMFFEGIRAARQLMRHAADRLSVRWFIGYDLGEPLPDHSSLTRIRGHRRSVSTSRTGLGQGTVC